MPKYLSLQIPTPCHENWDNMTPAQQGKFCGSCQKNVIDFTSMSDAQLANFFKRSKGEVCGRFNSEQLETDILIPKKRIPWVRYFFQIAIPAFLFSYKANAQLGKVKACTHTVDSTKEILGNIVPSTHYNKTINGQVTDEKGNGLGYASIVFKDGGNGIATDSNGHFSIPADAHHKILIVSHVGYESVEVVITNSQVSVTLKPNGYLKNIEIKSTEMGRTRHCTTGSVVSVTSGMLIRTISNKPIKTIVYPEIQNKNNFTIYPNPLPSGSQMNIQWKFPVNSDQVFLIYDAGGRLIQEKKMSWKDNSLEAIFNISHLAAGTYIMKVIDEKAKKSYSEKFVVQ
jgi:hypothetical protein